MDGWMDFKYEQRVFHIKTYFLYSFYEQLWFCCYSFLIFYVKLIMRSKIKRIIQNKSVKRIFLVTRFLKKIFYLITRTTSVFRRRIITNQRTFQIDKQICKQITPPPHLSVHESLRVSGHFPLSGPTTNILMQSQLQERTCSFL